MAKVEKVGRFYLKSYISAMGTNSLQVRDSGWVDIHTSAQKQATGDIVCKSTLLPAMERR
jgi:hypothetical protein